MAKDRLNVCEYYECVGKCKKGRDANYKGYCQICDKYKPRARIKHLNIKKQKLEKIKQKEWE